MIKDYINRLMRTTPRHLPDRVFQAGLWLVSFCYRAGIAVWDAFYRTGVLKRYGAGVPVISVGNVTVGGSGKTPFTIYLAGRLKKEGRQPAVLIRGYGDDEWRLAAASLDGIPVIKGADRVAAAGEAVLNHNCDVVILDDGFQHRRLRRDFNVLLVDSNDPFGNGHLFPRGILREPLSALRRADAVVLTKSDLGSRNVDCLKKFFSEKMKIRRVFSGHYRAAGLAGVNDGADIPLGSLRNARVTVFSGLADPAYFKFMVKKLGAVVEGELDFPDHHPYTAGDVAVITGQAAKSQSWLILTTEKDAVKVKGLPVPEGAPPVAALRIEFEPDCQMEDLIAGID